MPKVTFMDVDNQKTTLDIPSADRETAAAAVKAHVSSRIAKRTELEEQARATPNTAAHDNPLVNLAIGNTQGFADVGRSVGNMMGLVSDEKVRDARALDKDLLSTKAGLTGSIIGSTAATAPLMGGAGSAVGRYGGSVLARTLAQGATMGAVAANPNERLTGAVTGAALGGAMHGVARGVGRMATGLASIKPEAQKLFDAGEFVPLAMAAKEGGVSGALKTMYNELLRAMPIAGGAINKQTDEAFNAFRLRAAREALPSSARNLLNGVDDPHQIASVLQNFWAKPFNAFPIKIPKVTLSGVDPNVQSAVRQYLTGSLDDLMVLRNEIIPGLKNVPANQKSNFISFIDDTVKKNLDPNGRRTKLYTAYREAQDAYPKYRVVTQAIADASGEQGKFLPHALARVGGRAAGRSGAAQGAGPLQAMADEGVEVLERVPKRPGLYQHLAALGLLTGGHMGLGPMGAPSIIAASRGLASKPAQRALMGQFSSQRALASFLRQNARRVRDAGSVARSAAIAGVSK